MHRNSRRIASALVTGLLTVGISTVVPTPASSATTTLCSGYQSCLAAGYSDGGYAAGRNTSYWRMFAGRNCTNYVAFRLIRAGMPDQRPFAGTGNAWNWGASMPSLTDQTPAIGAVAWFDKSYGGAGPVGHVAIVERVVSSDEILVSESNWGSEFSWRRITRGSGWPSGFVHLKDGTPTTPAPTTPAVAASPTPAPTPAPTPVSQPVRTAVVTGTAVVGSDVSVTATGWTVGTTFGYQWALDGAPVAGAVAPSFRLTSAAAAKQVTVHVTPSNNGHAGVAVDSAPVTVAAGGLTHGGEATIAAIGTELRPLDTLSVAVPTISPAPRRTTIQWYSDDVAIAGATDTTLVVGPEHVGRSLRAVVTARRPGYAPLTITTSPRGPVTNGSVVVSAPSLVGSPEVGSKLTVRPGTPTPTDAVSTYTWLRDGVTIAGATKSSYLLTPDDTGRSVGAVMTTARTGWASAVTWLPGQVVNDSTSVRLKAVGTDDSVVVWFRVSDAGRPDGPASVRVGSVTRTVAVVDGVGRLRVAGLRPGSRLVKVWWTGQGRTEPSVEKVRVRVGGGSQ